MRIPTRRKSSTQPSAITLNSIGFLGSPGGMRFSRAYSSIALWACSRSPGRSPGRRPAIAGRTTDAMDDCMPWRRIGCGGAGAGPGAAAGDRRQDDGCDGRLHAVATDLLLVGLDPFLPVFESALALGDLAHPVPVPEEGHKTFFYPFRQLAGREQPDPLHVETVEQDVTLLRSLLEEVRDPDRLLVLVVARGDLVVGVRTDAPRRLDGIAGALAEEARAPQGEGARLA